MQIAVYGSGYLGSIISACVADFGLPVTCFDENTNRIREAAQGHIPFYEKNLEEVLRRNVRAGRLLYSTDMASTVQRANVIYLAEDDATTVEGLALKIAQLARPRTVLVLSSPMSVGTAGRVQQVLANAGFGTLPVVSQPLFFTSGCAIEDFNWPDRILLGTTSSEAVMTLKQLYRPLVMRGVPVIVTNHETAELVREASTAFVATKIAFINEIASLSEHVKADAVDLALALGLDKKIGPRCLQPGAGFGGPFVEAEMDSLSQLASEKGVSLRILRAAREVNKSLPERLVLKISSLIDNIAGKELGILGLAFKPNTNSVAGSAALSLARDLMSRGAMVRAYDPVAGSAATDALNGLRCCDNAYTAAEGADALVVGTGWPEFRALDFSKIKRLLKRPIIVDSKNLLDSHRLRSMGFQYVGIGRAS
ncbi:MAG: UDP-glucose dehydrogenase family protein [Terriglobales bacterium]